MLCSYSTLKGSNTLCSSSSGYRVPFIWIGWVGHSKVLKVDSLPALTGFNILVLFPPTIDLHKSKKKKKTAKDKACVLEPLSCRCGNILNKFVINVFTTRPGLSVNGVASSQFFLNIFLTHPFSNVRHFTETYFVVQTYDKMVLSW